MFRIPVITKNLLIINVLAYVATWVFKTRGIDLTDVLGLHFFLASDFSIVQLFTYMFMHANLAHLFFNMFALWMFGCVIENTLGQRKYVVYYLVCGLGAGLIQELVQFGSYYMECVEQLPGFTFADTMTVAHNSAVVLNQWTTVGASGAIYGILLAFGYLYPNERIFIFPIPIPIKAKWFVGFYVAIELFSALGTPGDSVAHFAHLGGMLFGFLLLRFWRDNQGGGGYGRLRGRQFFDNLKNNWERRSNRHADDFVNRNEQRGESDWDYNARKKAEQDELDCILDKVRRSGYSSLTDKEKQRLFDGGR